MQTAALTLRQVRLLLASLLEQALGYHRQSQARQRMNRRLRGNEEARFYQWRRHNRLTPQRFNQRPPQTQ